MIYTIREPTMRAAAVAIATVLCLVGCSDRVSENRERSEHPERPAFDESKVIDLTYAFNADSVYWPTAERFQLTHAARGRNEAGDWYASNNYAASEHGGTHLDAPLHFAEGGNATAQIPLTQLIGPARVIDIRDKCNDHRDYQLTAEDIAEHENIHGQIPPGSVVLIHTGFGRYYPNAKQYLGNDTRGVAKDLHFPGIGADAARVLVDRRVDLVGLDTASLDPGTSFAFPTHRILNQANIPGLENVANLDRLPPTGATVIALPMKIEDGTGGPCRIIAILP